ncbi:hypothetical protein [Natronorubrum daqingense]|uniref:Uncharacterized protein n=1 Tax=Natronorubrum daqingense TaxID=588898 RepID=A0A1N7E185_9EURY|nr:hypothetical protein [Natronorubrum daqingense]APX96295.1 hypothetical protein BB347_06495 [Natronorubrum daqingense]SIR81801.1 hypothetical protein SAMN05421809_2385 [Natronorubrum daqingense]
MQFKPIPEPPSDLASVESILEAVPETAGAVDDCCAHLVDETRLETRADAEAWLAFLRALELAREESAGYRRAEDAADRIARFGAGTDSLQESFTARVYAAETVLEALEGADEPRSVEAIFDDVRGEIPALKRAETDGDLESHWLERTRRLLEWAALLDLVQRTADGRYLRSSG